MVTAVWRGTAVSDNDRLCHGKQGRMFANREYVAFKEGMAWSLRSLENGRADGREASDVLFGSLKCRVSVTLRVDLPPRMDTSAIIKAAGDAVQLSGVIANDNQIDHWTVERVGRSPRGESRIEFIIESLGEGK